MSHQEIREKFIKFFESKGHKAVPSSSLLPNDQSVLFTTAGMQQFKEYYTHPENAPAQNVVSVQKCVRTSDIDEVGDESHLTFFEMLGNFSFGGYWKKEAIQYAHEFITQEMGLKIDYVTVFKGSMDIPEDEDSEKIWKEIDSNIKIEKRGREDNFWGPTGDEGPCGPTTEVYVNGIEIWNIVFNQYYKYKQPVKGLSSIALDTKGIDTGMGLERLAMVVQNKNNVFETDLFEPILNLMPTKMSEREKRIAADHSRAITFLINDGVKPSNKDQGYVLRRLMRRMIIYTYNLGSIGSFSGSDIIGVSPDVLLSKVVDIYLEDYKDLNKEIILSIFNEEWSKFQKTSGQGLRYLKNLKFMNSKIAFEIYSSFGLPFEVIKEMGPKDGPLGVLTREGFEEERKRHQEISRAGAEKKFGGHGIVVKEGDLSAENAEEMVKKTRLHTATHVVVAALEKVLGQKLPQAGSDITMERLRFDFAFPRKITPEELKQAEDIANDVVGKDLSVSFEEMDTDEAFKSGASGAFRHKYGDRVKVYSIGTPGDYFSRELCGGPHVTHTGEIGHIKITKEESVSGGNRRIRAVLE